MGDRARSLTIDGVRLIKDLKVVELKAELERRGLTKSGSKKELQERLRSVSLGFSVCCAAAGAAFTPPLAALLFATHISSSVNVLCEAVSRSNLTVVFGLSCGMESVQFENTKSKATASVNEEDVPNRWLQNEPNLDNNDYIREYFQSQKALYRQQIEVRRQYRETATTTVPGTSEVVGGSTADTHQPSTPLPPEPQPTQVTEAKVSSKGNINLEVNRENIGLGVVASTKASVVPISSCNITTSVASTISTITKSSATAVYPDTKKFITSKVAAFSATTKPPNPGYTAAPKALEGFSNPASTTLTTPSQIIHPDCGGEQWNLN
ncbi:hypothetical protein E2C01_026491 [Portunus trituberculatus]|uniref:SAP domain-containing protein n=1 Tax=Portunus trituberculatus TaxID=210409 RepID=A0A5B7EIF6_PORTR|nr:hypothetical protein [Portunus trituberculatus]